MPNGDEIAHSEEARLAVVATRVEAVKAELTRLSILIEQSQRVQGEMRDELSHRPSWLVSIFITFLTTLVTALILIIVR